MTTVPSNGGNLGLSSGFAPGYDGWGADMNLNLRILDAVICFTTTQAPLNTPPSSPSLGDRYIVGTAPTGVWSSNANNLAVWTLDETNTELWNFIAPQNGLVAQVLAAETTTPVNYVWAGGSWNEQSASSGVNFIIGTTTVSGAGTLIVTGVNVALSGTAGEAATLAFTAPVELYGKVPGTLTANQAVLDIVKGGAGSYTFPAALTNSKFSADVTATAATTFTLSNGGASVGTILYPAGSATGTPSVTSSFTVASGSEFLAIGPATPDATLAGVKMSFSGVRS